MTTTTTTTGFGASGMWNGAPGWLGEIPASREPERPMLLREGVFTSGPRARRRRPQSAALGRRQT